MKGYFFNSFNSTFSKCDKGCGECEEKSDYCLECAQDYYKLSLIELNNSSKNITLGKRFNCIKNCPDDYVINHKDKICIFFLNL